MTVEQTHLFTRPSCLLCSNAGITSAFLASGASPVLPVSLNVSILIIHIYINSEYVSVFKFRGAGYADFLYFYHLPCENAFEHLPELLSEWKAFHPSDRNTSSAFLPGTGPGDLLPFLPAQLTPVPPLPPRSLRPVLLLPWAAPPVWRGLGRFGGVLGGLAGCLHFPRCILSACTEQHG